jgi:multidrug resistance efflux pump
VDFEVDPSRLEEFHMNKNRKPRIVIAVILVLVVIEAAGAEIVQLKQARLNVQVEQANLDLLDVQIGDMTVNAPVDGVVMTRETEPGSVVTPGAELLTLSRLDELTITVYIPEGSYGKIKLGEAATVTVDPFWREVQWHC